MPFKIYGKGPLGLVDEKIAVNSIAVVPNPATTSAMVNIEMSENTNITLNDIQFVVYDQLGKEVMNLPNITSTSFEIQRGTLSAGSYTYKAINKNSGNSLNTGKLIFQ